MVGLASSEWLTFARGLDLQRKRGKKDAFKYSSNSSVSDIFLYISKAQIQNPISNIREVGLWAQ